MSKVREQRALAAHRQGLSKHSTQVKNRIHALLRRHDLRCPVSSVFSPEGTAWFESLALSPVETLERQQLLAQLDLVQAQLAEANTFIARHTQHDPRITRLMQIPGIGLRYGFSVLAAIGDINRFPSPKHLASYAGLVPSVHQSGQKNFTGHITKAGRPLLRWVMVVSRPLCGPLGPALAGCLSEHCQTARPEHCYGSSCSKVAGGHLALAGPWSPVSLPQPCLIHPQTKEWAWTIGHENLLAENSRAFVTHQLQVTDLALAIERR